MREHSRFAAGAPERALLLASLLALGCGAPRLVRIERLTDETFTPRASVLDVAVLSEEPDRAYREIARIEGGGNEYEEVGQVLGRLREEAAWLGADAILILRSGYRFEPHPRPGVHPASVYGYPDPSPTLGDPADPGAFATPYASVLAIRWAEASPPVPDAP